MPTDQLSGLPPRTGWAADPEPPCAAVRREPAQPAGQADAPLREVQSEEAAEAELAAETERHRFILSAAQHCDWDHPGLDARRGTQRSWLLRLEQQLITTRSASGWRSMTARRPSYAALSEGIRGVCCASISQAAPVMTSWSTLAGMSGSALLTATNSRCSIRCKRAVAKTVHSSSLSTGIIPDGLTIF